MDIEVSGIIQLPKGEIDINAYFKNTRPKGSFCSGYCVKGRLKWSTHPGIAYVCT